MNIIETEKKEYQEPQLIEWGSVYDLTQGSIPGDTSDADGYQSSL